MRRLLSVFPALLPLVLLVSACSIDRSQDQVRALTTTFFNALEAGDAAKAANLVVDTGGAIWPLINAAGEQKGTVPSYAIEQIHEIDAHDVRVLVVIPGSDTTTTITLTARRTGKTWKFDPAAQIETRFTNIFTPKGAAAGSSRRQ